MIKNSLEPDIISNTPRRHTDRSNRREISEGRRTVHSSQNHRTDSHKCGTSDHAHQQHCSSYSDYRYNRVSVSGNSSFGGCQNGYDITEDHDGISPDQRNIRLNMHGVQAENDSSKLLDIESSRSHGVSQRHRTRNLQPSSSEKSRRSYRYNRYSELSGQRLAITRSLGNNGFLSSPQEMLGDIDTNENDITYRFPNVENRHDTEEFDREIAKDIVQTLRTIGDDLDAKMRRNNEPFPRFVLDAIKSNTGRFLLMNVKHYNLVGIAIDATLAFLKHISQ